MPGRPMTEEQKGKKRERERERQNSTSNSSNLVEEVTPQILFLDTKPFVIWMRYFKWINRFFLCSEMKLEFLFSKITIICPLFGQKIEIVDLFVCLNKCFFFTPFAYTVTVFRCASTCSDKKILPLCSKHVIAMSFRKLRKNITSLCFQKFVLSSYR